MIRKFCTRPPLRALLPHELLPTQRALYDSIIQTSVDASGKPIKTRVDEATGSLHGPFNAMLLSPELGGDMLRHANTLRRGELAISPRVVEVAVLYAAAKARPKPLRPQRHMVCCYA